MNVKHQQFSVSGKKIHVFDNVFTFAQTQTNYMFLTNSLYKITGGAGVELEDRYHHAMQSMFSDEDLNNFGILKKLPSQAASILKGHTPIRSYSLLVNFTQKPHFHIDTEFSYTLLYYANPTWNPDWGGETVFANDDMDEVGYCSMYKPGRIVIFESSILHKPNTSVVGTPEFRSTFVVNFAK
jgi:hypothetical protein